MSCCCRLNIVTSGHRCGGSVPFRKSLYDTISSCHGCKCVQLYLGNPVGYDCHTIGAKDRNATLDYCLQNDVSFYIHCPVNANLAKKSCKSAYNVVSKELQIISHLPAACVLHIGKAGTDKYDVGNIESLGQNLNQLITDGSLVSSPYSKVPFHLLLEIAAGQKNELGHSLEEVRHLYEALDKTKIGMCIDTQHAFASGLCSFQSHEEIVKLFEDVQSIAPKGISMIHLNDSTKEFGSHVDRHAPLRQGHIWYHSDEGLAALIKLSKAHGIDLISETSDVQGDIELVKKYIN